MTDLIIRFSTQRRPDAVRIADIDLSNDREVQAFGRAVIATGFRAGRVLRGALLQTLPVTRERYRRRVSVRTRVSGLNVNFAVSAPQLAGAERWQDAAERRTIAAINGIFAAEFQSALNAQEEGADDT